MFWAEARYWYALNTPLMSGPENSFHYVALAFLPDANAV